MSNIIFNIAISTAIICVNLIALVMILKLFKESISRKQKQDKHEAYINELHVEIMISEEECKRLRRELGLDK